ncbi:MAG TPA: TetR/AcrR family transcriptional regulator [Actinophytocola sp.]|jgi:AcrR family transcriptional regulator|nr:TetR/AcrR family transcriptional regulator [Actinophytocola sp.]
MRTRLSTGQRREQLLAIGARLFADRPYDEVWIEEVAEIAEVSRGLLYHYFPTKKDFFLEVLRAQRDRLLEMSAPDPSLPVRDRLRAGLDVYLEFARAHPDGYRIVHRAAAGADREVREIREAGLAVNEERLLDALGELIPVTEATRLAVHGWLMFVSAVILDWLDHETVPHAELRAMCERALFAAVGLEV